MDKVLEKDRDLIYRCIAHHEMGDYHHLHPGKPVVDAEYNGTMEDFENVMCTMLGTSKLRDQGHLHKLPFFVRNLLEVIQEEDVREISEFNVVDSGAKLIRLRNHFGDKRVMEVLHFDINDLWQYLDSETAVKRVVKSKKVSFDPWQISWEEKNFQKFLFFGVALGITAIAAKVIDVWSPIDSDTTLGDMKRSQRSPNAKFIP